MVAGGTFCENLAAFFSLGLRERTFDGTKIQLIAILVNLFSFIPSCFGIYCIPWTLETVNEAEQSKFYFTHVIGRVVSFF